MFGSQTGRTQPVHGTWFDDVQSVSEALRVPPSLLTGLAVGGLAVLLLTAGTKSPGLIAMSCLVGVALSGMGVRAVALPCRPFEVKSLRRQGGLDYLNTTRRVGAFYVVAGLVYVVLALSLSLS